MDSLKWHLAILLNINAICTKSFRLDIFIDQLKQEKFLSTEEMDRMKSVKVTKGKQLFITIIQAKRVTEYSQFKKFMDCLKSDKSFREFESLAHNKYNELHKAISCILQSMSPAKAKGNNDFTSSYKIGSPRRSLSAAANDVEDINDSFILDCYLDYLKSRYGNLPVVSLQGWLHSETHAKKFTNITIVKALQKKGPVYLCDNANTPDSSEIEYSPHRCKSDDEIFKHDDSEDKLLILIEGNAGTGKTTYSYNICKRWMKSKVLAEYCFVVLIRLRDQRHGDVTDPKDLFTKVGDMAGILYTHLQAIHYTKRVLFWLEGWDELHKSYKSQSVFTQFLSGEIFPKATIVVSTRSYGTADLNQYKFVRQFKLLGFNKQQLALCAHDYFTNYYHQNEVELAYSNLWNNYVPSMDCHN